MRLDKRLISTQLTADLRMSSFHGLPTASLSHQIPNWLCSLGHLSVRPGSEGGLVMTLDLDTTPFGGLWQPMRPLTSLNACL
ncbi:unnamed protein product [Protopolystoma xenopodis]|uniref:Uncharacterized protein n=1 Tax=Protopolystoma xenopodis TaxID=117903 RepID=A0A448WLT8_9PLAT|nr:unnamed protein product [Protopolystoma xenopodis]